MEIACVCYLQKNDLAENIGKSRSIVGTFTLVNCQIMHASPWLIVSLYEFLSRLRERTSFFAAIDSLSVKDSKKVQCDIISV